MTATNDKQEFDGLVSTHLLELCQRAISDNKMVEVPSQPRSCHMCFMSFLLNISAVTDIYYK